jgi:hypothetical protein
MLGINEKSDVHLDDDINDKLKDYDPFLSNYYLINKDLFIIAEKKF